MNRVLQAARLHLVHPLVILGIPWLVVGLSFAINVADLAPHAGRGGGRRLHRRRPRALHHRARRATCRR